MLAVTYASNTGTGEVGLVLPNGAVAHAIIQYGENIEDYYSLEIPCGMSRWSRFVAVALASDLASIRSTSGTSGGRLRIKGLADGNAVDTYSMFLVEASPIDQQRNLYRVEFADKRFVYRYNTSNHHYNVPMPGQTNVMQPSGGSPVLLPTIIGDLYTDIGLTAPSLPMGYSTEQPDALIMKWLPSCTCIDALLFSYGLVATYDPSTNPATMTIEEIGNGDDVLDAFRDTGDGSSNCMRVDSRQVEKATVPDTLLTIYTYWNNPATSPGTDDDTNAITSSITGDNGQIPGSIGRAAPGFCYGTMTINGSQPDIWDSRTVQNRRDIYVDILPTIPVNGCVEHLIYRIRFCDGGLVVNTIVLYHRDYSPGDRPHWAVFTNMQASSFNGIGSMVNALGIPTYWGSNAPALARITAHTGTGPVNWNPYTLTLQGGSMTLRAYNGFEDDGNGGTLSLVGTPGSLGINVASDGKVNGGTCYVQAIGGALVPIFWDSKNSRWTFSQANSAQ